MEELPAVRLDRYRHQKSEVLAISFVRDWLLVAICREELGARWSRSNRAWLLPWSGENLLRTLVAFENYATIDQQALSGTKGLLLPASLQNPADRRNVQRFGRWMETQRLSPRTVNSYLKAVGFFLRYLELRKIEEITPKTIELFNYEFIVKQQKSVSYQNIVINALKHYFRFLGRDTELPEIARPIGEKRLPDVLSVDEVRRLLASGSNLKHRTLLSLIYSAGLRISEALSLELSAVDGQRMMLHIVKAKGHKDRYTLLSQKILALLREYYEVYRPVRYVFEGLPGEPYSARAAQEVLKAAVSRAGIRKRVTLHTLRHSFATHLLENGTDVRYIQSLLGHSSPKTTMIYTHISTTRVAQIRNPFDDL